MAEGLLRITAQAGMARLDATTAEIIEAPALLPRFMPEDLKPLGARASISVIPSIVSRTTSRRPSGVAVSSMLPAGNWA